jgi:AcrR family transcriptional regulator
LKGEFVRSTPVKDARVRKTQSRLRDALVSLIHEKRYGAIVVNEILQRADVGRSAFYAHFRNKDALLESGIEQILHSTPPRELPPSVGTAGKALWFSLPFFEFVGQCRHAGSPKMGRRGRWIIHQHLRHILTEHVRDELNAARPLKKGAARIPRELLAEFIVGSFILVLTWWVESNSPLSPREADDLFLELVVPTLRAESDGNPTALPGV